MPIDLVSFANVIISGILTGLVYGLMALGLSVIFGVARVVNFAHGEMMTLAMYASVILFSTFELNPFIAVLPVAAIFFVLGYGLQRWIVNPFVTRPEHAQFMLLLSIAIILTNGQLIIFGPDARSVRLDSLLESIELGPLLIDRGKLYAGAGRRRHGRGAVRLFPLHPQRHGDPRLRRQLARRQGRRPQRQSALRVGVRVGHAMRRGRRLHDGPADRPDAGHRPGLHAARVRDRHRRRPRFA